MLYVFNTCNLIFPVIFLNERIILSVYLMNWMAHLYNFPVDFDFCWLSHAVSAIFMESLHFVGDRTPFKWISGWIYCSYVLGGGSPTGQDDDGPRAVTINDYIVWWGVPSSCTTVPPVLAGWDVSFSWGGVLFAGFAWWDFVGGSRPCAMGVCKGPHAEGCGCMGQKSNNGNREGHHTHFLWKCVWCPWSSRFPFIALWQGGRRP